MHVTYLVTTILAALANGYAASLDLVGAESVKVVADRVQVSRGWMVPLGGCWRRAPLDFWQASLCRRSGSLQLPASSCTSFAL